MNSIINSGIDCFVVYADAETTLNTLKQLREEPLVKNIYVLMTGEEPCPFMGCEVIRVDNYLSSATVKKVAEAIREPFALMCLKQTGITFGYQAIRRMCPVASSVGGVFRPLQDEWRADSQVSHDGLLLWQCA